MPIALASAISTQKGTSAAAIPPERWKPRTHRAPPIAITITIAKWRNVQGRKLWEN
jgi:hypothetical protein